MNTTFVSTAIPYVNAHPHVGFALELIQADVIARYRRIAGYDTFFLTGTDENALKNVQAARQHGLTPRQFCDRNTAVFQRLAAALNISSDRFIRTSDPTHHHGASAFWRACRKSDIYLKRYEGRYCVACEDFYLEKDLADGRCPEHGTDPEIVTEQNYFFRLSAYQQILDDLIASDKLCIVPQARRNEALSFIRQGLQDFSISRPVERTGGWGVPVPDDPTQTVYVWFDALTNYLTGQNGGVLPFSDLKYWQSTTNKIHIIGKNVLKFHAIYWPALLLSVGLPLPDTLVVHGFLTFEGRKIGKSLGNAIDPFPIIESYGADAIRYALLRSIPSGADGDFSESALNERYAADLANGLGNLVHRLAALCERTAFCPETSTVPTFFAEVAEALDAYQFHLALQAIWDRVRSLNRQIETARPWEHLRDTEQNALHQHLSAWTEGLRQIAWNLQPFLPETARKIAAQCDSGPIRRQPPLFPRR